MPTYVPSLVNAEAAVTPSTQQVTPTRVVDQYTKYSEEVTNSLTIQLTDRGGYNSGSMHPHALTEHQEGTSAGNLTTLAPAGDTDMGQVFMASQPNVDHVFMRLSVTGAGGGLFADTFETYASETDLDASWVQSDLVNSPAALETTTVKSGTQAMAITVTKGASLLDTATYSITRLTGLTAIVGTFVAGEVVTGGTSGATATVAGVGTDFLTIVPGTVVGTFVAAEIVTGGTSLATATVGAYTASEDWSTMEDLRFSAQIATADTAKVTFKVRVGDGVNTKSAPVPMPTAGVWVTKTIPLASFVEDGVGTTNMLAIVSVEFEITLDGKAGTIYIDDMEVLADPGTIVLELYDAASAAPTTFGALIATSAATQLINNIDGRYAFNFSGAVVVPGQHYLLVVTAPSSPNVTIGLLGETGAKYVNGGAFRSADNGVTVVMLAAGSDASFEVWARIPALVVAWRWAYDGLPEHGVINIFAENETLERISRYFLHDDHAANELSRFGELLPYEIPITEKIESLVLHDIEGTAEHIDITLTLRYEPLTING